MRVQRRVCATCGAEYIEEGRPAERAACEGCARYGEVGAPSSGRFLPPSESFDAPGDWRPTRGDGKGGYSHA